MLENFNILFFFFISIINHSLHSQVKQNQVNTCLKMCLLKNFFVLLKLYEFTLSENVGRLWEIDVGGVVYKNIIQVVADNGLGSVVNAI